MTRIFHRAKFVSLSGGEKHNCIAVYLFPVNSTNKLLDIQSSHLFEYIFSLSVVIDQTFEIQTKIQFSYKRHAKFWIPYAFTTITHEIDKKLLNSKLVDNFGVGFAFPIITVSACLDTLPEDLQSIIKYLLLFTRVLSNPVKHHSFTRVPFVSTKALD